VDYFAISRNGESDSDEERRRITVRYLGNIMYYYQNVQGGPFSELDEIQHFCNGRCHKAMTKVINDA